VTQREQDRENYEARHAYSCPAARAGYEEMWDETEEEPMTCEKCKSPISPADVTSKAALVFPATPGCRTLLRLCPECAEIWRVFTDAIRVKPGSRTRLPRAFGMPRPRQEMSESEYTNARYAAMHEGGAR
jgi:hypothetical protein